MRALPIAGAIVIAVLTGAHAEGLGVIAAGAPGAERAALAGALVEAIGPRGRVVGDAVGAARAELAAGAVASSTLLRFRRVRDMIDDGWRAYLRVQIDFAQSRLAAARIAAEPLAALPGGLELYADAALRLGAVLQYRRIAGAPGVLALALALDPARPITLAEFSPDIVDAVDAVRAAPAAIQRVHVTTRPAGAMISIDGKELGRAPLDAQVTRGQHLVIARAPLHHPAVQGVLVDAAASVELALDRDDDAAVLARGAAPGLAEPAAQALVDATILLADLDDVVVAAISKRRGGPALVIQRCASVPARCTAVAEVGFDDRAGLAAAAREAWGAVQASELRELGEPLAVLGEVGEHGRPPATGCRLCKSPLVWSAVGAAVIGAVIAVVVTSRARPAPVVNVHGADY